MKILRGKKRVGVTQLSCSDHYTLLSNRKRQRFEQGSEKSEVDYQWQDCYCRVREDDVRLLTIICTLDTLPSDYSVRTYSMLLLWRMNVIDTYGVRKCAGISEMFRQGQPTCIVVI